MTTQWTTPTLISQYAETTAEDRHIPWLKVGTTDSAIVSRPIQTGRDLLHIARDPKHDTQEKTYFLKATGFNFTNLPEQISGVEIKLSMNRLGRITDDTIQLCLNNSLIGENQGDLDLAPAKVYNSEISLQQEAVQNSSFGVVLRFQSHPHWPHKCSAFIDLVQLRVY